MPEYKVKQPGFFGGVFRIPDGPHDPVVTATPLKVIPSWLELVDKAAPKPGKANKPLKPNDTPASFIDSKDKDNDVGLEVL